MPELWKVGREDPCFQVRDLSYGFWWAWSWRSGCCPSLDQGCPASETLRHSLSVQVRAGALGEGRLDVSQVSKGWPPIANKFRKC